jgi:hypothetical protein
MAIALTKSSLSSDLFDIIERRCIIKPAKTQYSPDPIPVVCFAVNDYEDVVYIPLGIWDQLLDDFPVRPYPKTKAVCTKTPYTIDTDPKGIRDQDVVIDEAIKKLKSDHVVFISAHTGYGKTSIGNFLACWSGLKTVVISHIDEVCKQWVEEFEEHSTAKVQRIEGKKPIDPTADVYIIGVQKAARLDRSDFSDIGLVIFDEAHVATISAFSKSLLKFCPKYVIGLSATPKRGDGMHKLLTMYFGPMKNFIVREEVKDFTVYKVETPYEPEIEYRIVNGQSVMNWTLAKNSIAYNEDRQALISQLVLDNPDHRILVLSDRKLECETIYDTLVEAGESVHILNDKSKSKKKKVNTADYRVLVAGYKKAGIGFNDPTLTMLILCTDFKNIIQFEGRIRTTNNIIYDIVDDFRTFENHWSKYRLPWYEKRGATIEAIPMRPHSTNTKTTTQAPTRRMLKPNK